LWAARDGPRREGAHYIAKKRRPIRGITLAGLGIRVRDIRSQSSAQHRMELCLEAVLDCLRRGA